MTSSLRCFPSHQSVMPLLVTCSMENVWVSWFWKTLTTPVNSGCGHSDTSSLHSLMKPSTSTFSVTWSLVRLRLALWLDCWWCPFGLLGSTLGSNCPPEPILVHDKGVQPSSGQWSLERDTEGYLFPRKPQIIQLHDLMFPFSNVPSSCFLLLPAAVLNVLKTLAHVRGGSSLSSIPFP